MAVLGRVLVSSAERLDLPDFLSIDSYTQGDFKYLIKSFVGSDKAYVLKGFEVINPNAAIDTQNISINIANSVVYYPDSKAGPFFYGLEDGNPKATPLVPELRKNATNYVYLVLSTSESAKDSRAFWDPDKESGVGGEFNQDVNTESYLSVEVNVSVSGFPDNVVPICKVVVGTSVVSSIEDARNLMFRLGSGGISPNPLSKFEFREQPLAQYKRLEPNTKMTKYDPNSFRGGDKNIYTLKEWMDAVMTRLLELGGTTYWYQDQSSYSLVNIFKDALATSIKSKGTWENSSTTPGLLTWTEDITIQSMTDKRDIVIRAGSKTLGNNQVMLIKQQRNIPINSGSVSADWIQSVNYINAQENGEGTFENLSKGDWIKKAGDPDYRYRRIERFWKQQDKSDSPTSDSAIALSIELNDTYEGLSELSQAIFSKGEYTALDIQVLDRDDPILYDAGGDLCWLATRSDRVLNVSEIVSSQLTIDIKDHDGEKAKCLSTGHSLSDKQRIYIASPSLFEGEYQIEVESADIFYIVNSNGPFADETGANAYFATVTTSANYSDPGNFLLESENHGFDVDHTVYLSGSTNYNSTYSVFPKTATEFTIPVSSLLPTESFISDPAKATSVEIYVRTDLGPTKIEQGEIKQIGKVDSQNIMSFIGMENSAMMKPVYSVEPFYNAIYGKENYNSSSADNLTQRASKLTAMMANKTQDKTISCDLQNVYAIVCDKTSNVPYADIAVFAKSGTTPKLIYIQPSSLYKLEITLTGTLSLLSNQVAYVSLNRNANTILSNLTQISVCDIDKLPLEENVFIFAIRGNGESVNLWDKTPIRTYSNVLGELAVEETSITVPSAASISSGQYFTINSVLDVKQYYVWFKKNGVGTDPLVVGKIGIEVPIITGDGATNVAIATSSAINSAASAYFTATPSGSSVMLTNSVAGFCTDAANFNVGGAFSITINTEGSGAILNYVSDGDLLETAIKKLDQKLAEIAATIPQEAYEETINVSSIILSGGVLVLPLHSRSDNMVKGYVVGEGQLEVFLNGQYLTLGEDWSEVGSSGSESISIQTLQDLHPDDIVLFRIDNYSVGSGGSGGGSFGEANTASNVGGGQGNIFQSKVGIDLRFRSLSAGAGVSITQSSNVVTISSTPTASLLNIISIVGYNYSVLSSNDVILVYNDGVDVNITLPSAVLNPGKRFDIKKVDIGSVVKIKGSSGETLDGVDIYASSIDIEIPYECVTVVSDGLNWFII
jgi:hypothetical protein